MIFSGKYDKFVLSGGKCMIELKDIYLDTLSLMDSLKGYASPKSKLTTMIKSGEVIPIRRGLYVRGGGASYSIRTLANKIYGPSYISFEYALSYYGFIPERVENVTSAVFNKNKNKAFRTPAGSFFYRSIPNSVYYQEVTRREENGHPFLIASREKTLCDTVYKYRTIKSFSHLSHLFYSDLRLDPETLSELDVRILEKLSPLYGKRILSLFAEWIKKELGNA